MTVQSSNSSCPPITYLDICKAVTEVLSDIPNLQVPVNVVGDVKDAIEKRLSKEHPYKIHVEENTWLPKAFMGALLRYKTYARVVYPATENPCWRRFVMAKEMAHLIIDTDSQQYTQDPIRLIQELINRAPIQFERSHQLESEQIAVYVAYELLIPWKFNAECLQKLADGESMINIAKWLRIPQKAVEFVLSPPYQESRAIAYKALGL